MKRVVSGIRPTGRLHIGHLKGIIENWVKLQEEYETFYFIADIHSYTTNLSTAKSEFYYDIVRDLLAEGINPDKSTLFVQSEISQHSELSTLLSMVTPLGWLQRCPTFKEAISNTNDKEMISLGLISYPVLMTSDVVLYDANFVPVGKDQLPHLELAREIVRRFNRIFGKTFVEPKSLLTKFPLLIGTDNRKMSKSYDNCIYLNENDELLRKKIMSMITDKNKVRRNDPGEPNVCNVFSYHNIFGTVDIEEIEKTCKSGELGCVDCKKNLCNTMSEIIGIHRKKKSRFSNEYVREILEEGRKKASKIAKQKIKIVKENMGMRL